MKAINLSLKPVTALLAAVLSAAIGGDVTQAGSPASGELDKYGGWMDAWPSREPGMQHSGVQDPFGKYDQPITSEM